DEIRAIAPRGDPNERAAQAERLRKMLLAMVEDIRVVPLTRAPRTAARGCLMRGVAAMLEQRQQAAREALELFAPLANRLGVWQLKWELEDLAFRCQEPDTYKRIARELDEKRVDRETFIAEVIDTLR